MISFSSETVSRNLNTASRFYVIVLGIAHQEFLYLDLDTLKKDKAIVYDVKEIYKTKRYPIMNRMKETNYTLRDK